MDQPLNSLFCSIFVHYLNNTVHLYMWLFLCVWNCICMKYICMVCTWFSFNSSSYPTFTKLDTSQHRRSALSSLLFSLSSLSSLPKKHIYIYFSTLVVKMLYLTDILPHIFLSQKLWKKCCICGFDEWSLPVHTKLIRINPMDIEWQLMNIFWDHFQRVDNWYGSEASDWFKIGKSQPRRFDQCL